MCFKRGLGYDIMTDDILTTVTVIFAIISLIAGAAGAFIYFRVSLENRLTTIETTLPEGKLGGYETRLNELERKMLQLEVVLDAIKEVGTDRVKDIFGKRHS